MSLQATAASGDMTYALSMYYNATRLNAFNFIEEILYLRLSLHFFEHFDVYKISFNNIYSKCIIKFIIFEEVFEELLAVAWHPDRVY